MEYDMETATIYHCYWTSR